LSFFAQKNPPFNAGYDFFTQLANRRAERGESAQLLTQHTLMLRF